MPTFRREQVEDEIANLKSQIRDGRSIYRDSDKEDRRRANIVKRLHRYEYIRKQMGNKYEVTLPASVLPKA